MNWLCNSRNGFGLAGLAFIVLRLVFSVGLLAAGQTRLRAGIDDLYFTGPATNSQSSTPLMTMGWDPSPDASVVGYLVCWGLASGQCTNQFDVGNVTNATAGGFVTNVTYYFTVVAFNDVGEQADPSNEIQYSITTVPPAGGPLLGIQSTPGITNGTPARLSFQGWAGATYTVLATQDFQQWVSVWTTNCPTDGPVAYDASDMAAFPMRFYRLVQQ